MPSFSGYAKIILTLGSIIIIGILMIAFLILPQVSKISLTATNIQKSQQELIQIKLEAETYKELVVEFEKVANERIALEKMFPLREEMVSLVENLEATATFQAQAIPRTLSFVDKKEDMVTGQTGSEKAVPLVSGLSRIEEIPYTFEILGNYRQFVDFLQYLENLPFFTELASLSITADSFQDASSKTVRNSGRGLSQIQAVFFIKAPESLNTAP